MDQAHMRDEYRVGSYATFESSGAKKTADRASLIVFSAVVSLAALVAVISRWHAFHWWSKLEAIFLSRSDERCAYFE